MRLSEIERLRRQPGCSLLLFVTDRCSVGCAHCSVDSRPNSPVISDHKAFEILLDAICELSSLRVVGISGGEPLQALDATDLSTRRLQDAEKATVLYSSGVWAGTNAGRVQAILGRVSTVVLSTDPFHRRVVSLDQLEEAARSVVAAGAWLILQVIHAPEGRNAGPAFLERSLGSRWRDLAEVHDIPLLAHGRARPLLPNAHYRPLEALAPCSRSCSPVVRYDGRVSVCSNESVIMGLGPEQLRGKLDNGIELSELLDRLGSNAIVRKLQVLNTPGSEFPDSLRLSSDGFQNVCDLCWKLHAAQSRGVENAP